MAAHPLSNHTSTSFAFLLDLCMHADARTCEHLQARMRAYVARTRPEQIPPSEPAGSRSPLTCDPCVWLGARVLGPSGRVLVVWVTKIITVLKTEAIIG